MRPCASSHPPNRQCRLSTRRVTLDPVDSCRVRPVLPCLRCRELIARVARLEVDVGAVAILLAARSLPIAPLATLGPPIYLRTPSARGDPRGKGGQVCRGQLLCW